MKAMNWLVALIMFNVGLAWGDVGKISNTCNEATPWWLPLAVLLIMGAPAFLGYLVAKEEDQC